MKAGLVPGAMTREEAIDKATLIVEQMGNVEDLNKRGYKIDGWKPPTTAERAEAIIKIAGFLVGPDRPPTLVAPAHNPNNPATAPPVSRGTQHKASCHGAIGELQCEPGEHP